jgi:hypothetical protein
MKSRREKSQGKVGSIGTDKLIHFGQMSEGKKPSGRPTSRWEDNIKTNLKQT